MKLFFEIFVAMMFGLCVLKFISLDREMNTRRERETLLAKYCNNLNYQIDVVSETLRQRR